MSRPRCARGPGKPVPLQRTSKPPGHPVSIEGRISGHLERACEAALNFLARARIDLWGPALRYTSVHSPSSVSSSGLEPLRYRSGSRQPVLGAPYGKRSRHERGAPGRSLCPRSGVRRRCVKGWRAVTSATLDRIHGTGEARESIRFLDLLFTRVGDGSSCRSLRSPGHGHAWPGAEPSSSAAQPLELPRHPKSP